MDFETASYMARCHAQHPAFFAPHPFYPRVHVHFQIGPGQVRGRRLTLPTWEPGRCHFSDAVLLEGPAHCTGPRSSQRKRCCEAYKSCDACAGAAAFPHSSDVEPLRLQHLPRQLMFRLQPHALL